MMFIGSFGPGWVSPTSGGGGAGSKSWPCLLAFSVRGPLIPSLRLWSPFWGVWPPSVCLGGKCGHEFQEPFPGGFSDRGSERLKVRVARNATILDQLYPLKTPSRAFPGALARFFRSWVVLPTPGVHWPPLGACYPQGARPWLP